MSNVVIKRGMVAWQERTEEAKAQDREQTKAMQQYELVEKEKKRRSEQARRVVMRMIHRDLVRTFDLLCRQLESLRRQRITSQRVIVRMLHAKMSSAFEALLQRTLVARRQRDGEPALLVLAPPDSGP